MTEDEWTIGLVFEAPGGAYHEEPRRFPGDLPRALALARRDARAAAFGRAFRGFSLIERVDAHGGPAAPPLRAVEQDPARPLPGLLAPFGHTDSGDEASETARYPARLEGLAAVRWWELAGAFGAATEVGVALGRCASVDPAEAAAAAATVGSGIAHQRTLYPVAAPALPFLVELLSVREVHCRAALADWLQVVCEAAHDANDLPSNLMAWTAKLVARDMAEVMASHQRSARAVAEALVALQPRLELLSADPELGPRLGALLPRR